MVKDIKECRDCNISSNLTYISKRGLCTICSNERMINAAKQIKNKQGKVWDKYHTNMSKYYKYKRGV